ncbi:hypothetical protein BDV96DRAFT_627269 [Lophiotrema nucula]|uniref:Uncharacterized protein n=1 Tax=Lophiotrema nucula TaxID=690887 RepID=A0A6A5ZQZ5_9PLEO|nr:hypothetical protein BDV96DRAFT_627269 [Lophiotrema nucula]
MNTSGYFQAFTKTEWTPNKEPIRMHTRKIDLEALDSTTYCPPEARESRKAEHASDAECDISCESPDDALSGRFGPIKPAGTQHSRPVYPSWLWIPLTYAYVLGEQLLDPYFQTAILGAMGSVRRVSKTVPELAQVGILYDGTPPGSDGRKRFAEHYAQFSDRSRTFRDTAREAGEEFVEDLLRAFVKERDSMTAEWMRSPSMYHEVVLSAHGFYSDCIIYNTKNLLFRRLKRSLNAFEGHYNEFSGLL